MKIDKLVGNSLESGNINDLKMIIVCHGTEAVDQCIGNIAKKELNNYEEILTSIEPFKSHFNKEQVVSEMILQPDPATRKENLKQFFKFGGKLDEILDSFENFSPKSEILIDVKEIYQEHEKVTSSVANPALNISPTNKAMSRLNNLIDRSLDNKLKKAIKEEDDKSLRAIISKMTDLDSQDESGNTALVLAIEQNFDFGIKLLIEKGAGLDHPKINKEMLLFTLINNPGYAGGAVKKLIEAGADCNARKDDKTPLYCALIYPYLSDCIEVAVMLIEHGADVNATNLAEKETALMVAVLKNHNGLAKRLVEKNATINAKNTMGTTALVIALHMNNSQMAELLVNKGADVNASYMNNLGDPLRLALTKKNQDMAKLLIEKGANVDATWSDGHSPLSLALTFGFEDLARRIVDEGPDNKKWMMHSGHFLAFSNLKNPTLLNQMLAHFTKISNAENLSESKEKSFGSDFLLLPNLLITSMEIDGIPKKNLDQIIQAFKSQKSTLKDDVKRNIVLKALSSLANNPNLSTQEKGEVIEIVTKNLLQNAPVMQGILDFGAEERLKSDQPLEDILKEKFFTEIFGDESKEIETKWNETLKKNFRNDHFLMLYAAKLSNLPSPEKEKSIQCFKVFINSILDNDYQTVRYSTDNNPQIKRLSTMLDLDKWKENTEAAVVIKESPEAPKTVDYKTLVQETLPHNQLPLVEKALNGENVAKELGALIKADKKNPNLLLQSYLIKLLKGQDPKNTLSSIANLLEKVDGFDRLKSEVNKELEAAKKEMPVKKKSYKGWKIVNTDNPSDIFHCGSEIIGSCQSVFEEADKNKCLLGYAINGANRMIAIKDETGRIQARSIIRVSNCLTKSIHIY